MSLLGAVRSGYVNVEVPLLATTMGDVFLGRGISYFCIQGGEETLLFFVLVQDQHLSKANVTQGVQIPV